MRALRTKRLAYGCGSAEMLSFEARRNAPPAVLATFPSTGHILNVDLQAGTPRRPAFCRIQGNQLTPVAIGYFALEGRRVAVEEDTQLLLRGRRLVLRPLAESSLASSRRERYGDLSAECQSFPLPGSYTTRGKATHGVKPPTIVLQSDVGNRVGSCWILRRRVPTASAYFASYQELFGRVTSARAIRSCASVSACELEEN